MGAEVLDLRHYLSIETVCVHAHVWRHVCGCRGEHANMSDRDGQSAHFRPMEHSRLYTTAISIAFIITAAASTTTTTTTNPVDTSAIHTCT
jgi:hypothetical protein